MVKDNFSTQGEVLLLLGANYPLLQQKGLATGLRMNKMGRKFTGRTINCSDKKEEKVEVKIVKYYKDFTYNRLFPHHQSLRNSLKGRKQKPFT